jgi:hypothetical protein
MALSMRNALVVLAGLALVFAGIQLPRAGFQGTSIEADLCDAVDPQQEESEKTSADGENTEESGPDRELHLFAEVRLGCDPVAGRYSAVQHEPSGSTRLLRVAVLIRGPPTAS